MVSVDFKTRLDAHKLIEEFMVLANVAAAEELQRLKQPLLYRVHEEPSPDKLDSLREVAEASGFTLAKGQVLKTAHLNRLLAQAEGSDYDELLNITTLRSMTQAYYDPRNFGHFGLALKDYAHFTSPIRRYSDLIVHRALIRGHGWGDDGLSPCRHRKPARHRQADLGRRAPLHGRRTRHGGPLPCRLSLGPRRCHLHGRVSGVQRLSACSSSWTKPAPTGWSDPRGGARVLHYDPESQTLMGADTGLTIGIGARVTVRLREAMPVTGG